MEMQGTMTLPPKQNRTKIRITLAVELTQNVLQRHMGYYKSGLTLICFSIKMIIVILTMVRVMI